MAVTTWIKEQHRNPLAMDPSVYTISSAHLSPALARSWLQQECDHLFKLQSHGFFIQPSWLDTWLENLPDDYPLIAISATLDSAANNWHGQICAAAIFGIHERQAFLHRSGIDSYDQIWVEYNRFISHPMLPNDVQPAMLKSMFNNYPLTAIHCAMTEVTPDLTSLMKHCGNFSLLDISHQERGWYVPLQQVSHDLHFNRSLRRALKNTDHFAKVHNWQIHCCDAKNAWNALSESAHFHIKKWQNSATPSGFLNPNFKSFHQQYLAGHQALVFSLLQGEQQIGAVYVLKSGRKLGFYLGCYDDTLPSRVRLGLWAHAQILNWAERNGFLEYDFMAGEARYKSDFTPHTRLFIAFSLYRNTLKHRAWLFVRDLYLHMKKRIRTWLRTTPDI